MHLAEAYRSLARPSSALEPSHPLAGISSLCPTKLSSPEFSGALQGYQQLRAQHLVALVRTHQLYQTRLLRVPQAVSFQEQFRAQMLSALICERVAARHALPDSRQTRGVVGLFLSYQSQPPFRPQYTPNRQQPTCLTTVQTQLTISFNRRTTSPLAAAARPGWKEPTSRQQATGSICALAGDDSVIPGVAFLSSNALTKRAERFAKPDFRLITSCYARQHQADLCLYTLRWVSDPTESTLGRP
eukprot:TRINITY_DN6262_c0_g1_i1.p1 TRINITY_DN6262_c0_g1~~TRINITY_DN6262_c0_g1_i1.p1  ORF type:complete len:244 (+),score=-49.07 TRINITY_DN6262_c0_g1_i1:2381-3112(+)